MTQKRKDAGTERQSLPPLWRKLLLLLGPTPACVGTLHWLQGHSTLLPAHADGLGCCTRAVAGGKVFRSSLVTLGWALATWIGVVCIDA
jgi:hypothetical protein